MRAAAAAARFDPEAVGEADPPGDDAGPPGDAAGPVGAIPISPEARSALITRTSAAAIAIPTGPRPWARPSPADTLARPRRWAVVAAISRADPSRPAVSARLARAASMARRPSSVISGR